MTKFDEMVLEELNNVESFEEAIWVLEDNGYSICYQEDSDMDGWSFGLDFEYEGDEEDTDIDFITLHLVYNKEAFALKQSEEDDEIEAYEEIVELGYIEDWSSFGEYIQGCAAECWLKGEGYEMVSAIMTEEEFCKCGDDLRDEWLAENDFDKPEE